MTLDDRSNINDFKEAIDQFYSDKIVPHQQSSKKQPAGKVKKQAAYEEDPRGYFFLVIMPDNIKQELFYINIKSKINSDTPVISQFVAAKTIMKYNDRIFINILR